MRGPRHSNIVVKAGTPTWELGVEWRLVNGSMRRARLGLNYTQHQLAELAHTQTSEISAIECLRKRPSDDLALRIAIVLELAPEHIWPSWLEPKKRPAMLVTRPISEEAFSELDDNVRQRLYVLPDGVKRPSIESFHVKLERAMRESLGPREYRILQLYFGLGDGPPLSFEQIGGQLGVVGGRVNQIAKRALGKLRGSQHANVLQVLWSEIGDSDV